MWDRIAPAFDRTRMRPWRAVVDVLHSLPRDARVLDAGCGNGRHAREAALGGLGVVGLDFSRALLDRARARGVPVVLGVLERLPFAEATFDAAICVAALHHVRGRAGRRAVLAELHRVVRPGGRLLVTVWAREALPRPRQTSVGGEPGDAFVPWRAEGAKERRFVHFYEADELLEDLAASGWPLAERSTVAFGGRRPDNHLATASRPAR